MLGVLCCSWSRVLLVLDVCCVVCVLVLVRFLSFRPKYHAFHWGVNTLDNPCELRKFDKYELRFYCLVLRFYLCRETTIRLDIHDKMLWLCQRLFLALVLPVVPRYAETTWEVCQMLGRFSVRPWVTKFVKSTLDFAEKVRSVTNKF
jgi:hypothetical protein